MANTKLLSKEKGKLTWAQRSYFMFGSCWSFLDRAFPFSSENERENLWKSRKEEVIDLIYCDISYFPDREWQVPGASQLRPCEWWLRDAPEPRLFLDERETLRETELEFLKRVGLLGQRDREKIATKEFQEAEEKSLAYRKYIMETPFQVAQPLPIEQEIMEQGGMTVREVGGRPEKNSSTDLTSFQETLEQAGITRETANTKEGGISEKPAPPEPAGMCPKCSGRLSVHSPVESICKRCGIVFNLESLARLWRGKDDYEREKRKGHLIDGD